MSAYASPDKTLANSKDINRMATTLIHEDRIEHLNEKDIQDGAYVLYWMQSSQRAEYNHALEYSVQQANALNQRLLVVFGLTDDYP
jgi:deoxyribodipyrimidine photo-lyase